MSDWTKTPPTAEAIQARLAALHEARVWWRAKEGEHEYTIPVSPIELAPGGEWGGFVLTPSEIAAIRQEERDRAARTFLRMAGFSPAGVDAEIARVRVGEHGHSTIAAAILRGDA